MPGNKWMPLVYIKRINFVPGALNSVEEAKNLSVGRDASRPRHHVSSKSYYFAPGA